MAAYSSCELSGGSARGSCRGVWSFRCLQPAGRDHLADEAPKTWHVLEFKTHGVKSFADLTAKGVVLSKPQHAAQMQIYMHLTGIKRGEIRALASMGVLTTGFNAPGVDLIALLRPTKSAGLYVQMVGRGTRLAPGKENCLVLDFAGNVRRHGPIDLVRPKRPGEAGGGEAPTKVCPDCDSIFALSAAECPDCGYVFPAREVKIAPTAATLPVLSPKVQWPNFSPAEIACRGTGKLLINEAALDMLQALRDRLGKPLIVRSALGLG